MMKALRLRLHEFGKDTSGNMSVETVLIFPMLLWFYLSTFTYFDAYRAQATNIKASYTIADAISRQDNGIGADYMDTMHELMQFLNNSSHNMRIRFTVYTRDDNDDVLLRWSCTRGSGGSFFQPHTQGSLRAMDRLLPPSPQPDEMILVETWVDYAPPFSARLFDDEAPTDGLLHEDGYGNSDGIMIGLSPTTFSNVVVTRPRPVNLVPRWNDTCG